MVDMNASDYRLLILSPMHENLASWYLKFAKSGTVSRSSSCELAFKFLVNTSAPGPGRDFRVDASVRYHLYHSISSVARPLLTTNRQTYVIVHHAMRRSMSS